MNVALAGYGIEGKASYDYWRAQGHDITVADERERLDVLPDGVNTILGPDAFTRLGEFDLIVRSPSVNPKKLPYGDKVWSATNEFFAKCPTTDIIGVTGTKGKGTTSSLIASILKAAGRTVHLVGNIGTPALAELPRIQPDDIVVYELSSFQLWDVKRSPHVAVVLMIEPDHLDIHDGMDDYVDAKRNIVRFQQDRDVVVFNQNDARSSDIAASTVAQKRTYPFELGELANAVTLPGAHNQENASAAIMAVQDYVSDQGTLAQGLGSFSGLPHRLKFVREVGGVKFYDDSIATTPGSAIAAIRSFDAPKVLILGGYDKGADYTELIELCESTETKILAVGANGSDIAALGEQLGATCEREEGDMTAIVTKAFEIAQPGDVVILSPAAASFDMFKSYADRGDQFVTAVERLEA